MSRDARDATVRRWVVRTDSLPVVSVEEVLRADEACTFDELFHSEQEAWRAASEHIAAYLQDCVVARRIVVSDLEHRIAEAERWWAEARKRARG